MINLNSIYTFYQKMLFKTAKILIRRLLDIFEEAKYTVFILAKNYHRGSYIHCYKNDVHLQLN